jgi:hypothetical protein
MRVKIVLGRACILRGSRTAGGPVPLRGAGLRGRRDPDSPELWRAATYYSMNPCVSDPPALQGAPSLPI